VRVIAATVEVGIVHESCVRKAAHGCVSGAGSRRAGSLGVGLAGYHFVGGEATEREAGDALAVPQKDVSVAVTLDAGTRSAVFAVDGVRADGVRRTSRVALALPASVAGKWFLCVSLPVLGEVSHMVHVL
jgi:hypothetical protein